MELRSLIIGVLIWNLTGCTGIQSDVPDATVITIRNDGYSASIMRPKGVANQYERRDGSTAYTSFEAPTTDYLASDIMLEVYPKLQFGLDCSPAITGASQTQVMEGTNGDTSWGKVDAFDRLPYDFAPGTQPLCRPPVLEWSFFGEMEYKRISDDAAYALCSEKDGRRVLICISQMTDNPQLAEEIFRTFRWTD